MEVLTWIILATFTNGLIGLIGAFSLFLNDKIFRKLIYVLVAFAAGSLLSGALFHLLAESLDHLDVMTAFFYLLVGFVLFFIIERFLHWHHCHETKCKVHPYSYLVLFGDGIHNFIDGLVIAASFLVDVPFGIITTLLIIGHEIPQELGDFAILVHGGMKKNKALVYNYISQLTCVIGGFVGFILSNITESIVHFLLPFAAGGFIYIAASDLIPELHREPKLSKSLVSFFLFLVGIGFMFSLKILLEH